MSKFLPAASARKPGGGSRLPQPLGGTLLTHNTA
jgi:hypothetical protein